MFDAVELVYGGDENQVCLKLIIFLAAPSISRSIVVGLSVSLWTKTFRVSEGN